MADPHAADDLERDFVTRQHHMTMIRALEWANVTLERQLHRRFASARIRGEWFWPTPELVATMNATAWRNVDVVREAFVT